jgi:adenine/guanine phosphoribosyltransferase-like PRPP-binding protein
MESIVVRLAGDSGDGVLLLDDVLRSSNTWTVA